MEAFVIAGTLIGSFVTAFIIQKAALEGLLRIMMDRIAGRGSN